MQAPQYKARDGKEDRHGEMTGAISFNMVFVFLLTTIWCVVIAPLFLPLWAQITTGVAVAMGTTAIGLPISQRVWAQFSHWTDEQARQADEKNRRMGR